jgi:hypothetical protein
MAWSVFMLVRVLAQGKQGRDVGDERREEFFDGAPGIAVDLGGAGVVVWEADDGDGDEQKTDGEETDVLEASSGFVSRKGGDLGRIWGRT